MFESMKFTFEEKSFKQFYIISQIYNTYQYILSSFLNLRVYSIPSHVMCLFNSRTSNQVFSFEEKSFFAS